MSHLCVKRLLMLCSLMFLVFFTGISYGALPPYYLLGEVIEKDSVNKTITIRGEYSTMSPPNWAPYTGDVTGTPPNDSALDQIGIGDYIMALSYFGLDGGGWAGLAKLVSNTRLFQVSMRATKRQFKTAKMKIPYQNPSILKWKYPCFYWEYKK